MKKAVLDPVLDQLFRQARSINVWEPAPVSEADLKAIYDLTKMGPTSANCSPARFCFVVSKEAKAQLKPHMSPGNDEKVMAAPATVIIGYDRKFADKLAQLFPHNLEAKNWFADPVNAEETAFRNSSLQGAYFMLAARALGFDCGPMSGFDKAGVEQAFFKDSAVKVNFICSIGRGSNEGIFERLPRLAFEEAATIL